MQELLDDDDEDDEIENEGKVDEIGDFAQYSKDHHLETLEDYSAYAE